MQWIPCNRSGSTSKHGISFCTSVAWQKSVRFICIKKIMACSNYINSTSIDGFHLVTSPISHNVANFVQNLRDILIINTVYAFKSFSCSSWNHTDTTDVSCPTQKTCSFWKGGRRRYCWSGKSSKNKASRYIITIYIFQNVPFTCLQIFPRQRLQQVIA